MNDCFGQNWDHFWKIDLKITNESQSKKFYRDT